MEKTAAAGKGSRRPAVPAALDCAIMRPVSEDQLDPARAA
jgi:hypothetical protein